MLNDGTTTATYNEFGQLTGRTVNATSVATTYASDADGVLVGQTTGGTTTRYVQDRSAGLPQVLAAGSTNYVYGAERLYGLSAGVRTWELHDALGSVRRTTSGTTVSAPISDDASGQVRGGATLPRFGYTGELQDAATGQVYLRARWYNAASGRFGSRDDYAGEIEQPQSLHRYAYVHNDPVNATDPSGMCSTTPGQGDDSCAKHNPRDLTDWLYRTLKANARDPRTKDIRRLNELARNPGWSSCDPRYGTGGSVNAGGYAKVTALFYFRELMADRKEWDFKHTIKEYLDEGTTMCGLRSCRNDIEFSVYGNIHYGFIALAAGFDQKETLFGAGYAEKNDPAHVVGAPNYSPYNGVDDPDSKRGLPNYGDEASDNRAVWYGMRLYTWLGPSMSYRQFAATLDTMMPQLDHNPPSSFVVRGYIQARWPYPVGFFAPHN